MHQVTKLLTKVAVLGLLGFGIVELVVRLNPFASYDLENHYAASMIDRQAALHKLPSPKLVLVAGSNFGYGINSEMIQDSLHMPVMNMSFQYFLGAEFLINQVEKSLRSGDILLLGFEYIATTQGMAKEKLTVASFYPPATDWIHYNNPLEFMSGQLLYRIDRFRGILNRIYIGNSVEASVEDKSSVFFRKAINQHGDLLSHLNNTPVPFGISEIPHESDMSELIAYLNKKTDELSQKGVRVMYTFPSFSETSYQKNQNKLTQIEGNFKSARFTVLDTPKRQVYPDSLFHDMAYHLNGTGRTIRTQLLIESLRKHLAK